MQAGQREEWRRGPRMVNVAGQVRGPPSHATLFRLQGRVTAALGPRDGSRALQA